MTDTRASLSEAHSPGPRPQALLFQPPASAWALSRLHRTSAPWSELQPSSERALPSLPALKNGANSVALLLLPRLLFSTYMMGKCLMYVLFKSAICLLPLARKLHEGRDFFQGNYKFSRLKEQFIKPHGPHDHCSIIHNSQHMETTCVHWWMSG